MNQQFYVDDVGDVGDDDDDVGGDDFWNHVGNDVVGDDSNCDDAVVDDVGDEDLYHAVMLNKCYYLTYMR